MGIRDRDYMRPRDDDDAALKKYEREAREQGYGDLAGRPRTNGRTIALLVAAAVVIAVVLALFI